MIPKRNIIDSNDAMSKRPRFSDDGSFSMDESLPLEYPVRPGHDDCQYFLKNGYCHWGIGCKYNHPRGIATAPPPNIPINPCMQFLRGGQCNFGDACKYSHIMSRPTRGFTGSQHLLNVMTPVAPPQVLTPQVPLFVPPSAPITPSSVQITSSSTAITPSSGPILPLQQQPLLLTSYILGAPLGVSGPELTEKELDKMLESVKWVPYTYIIKQTTGTVHTDTPVCGTLSPQRTEVKREASVPVSTPLLAPILPPPLPPIFNVPDSNQLLGLSSGSPKKFSQFQNPIISSQNEFSQSQDSAIHSKKEFSQSHDFSVHSQKDFGQSHDSIIHSQHEFNHSQSSYIHSQHEFNQSQGSVMHLQNEFHQSQGFIIPSQNQFSQSQNSDLRFQNQFGQSQSSAIQSQHEFNQSHASVMHSQNETSQPQGSMMHFQNQFSQSQSSIMHSHNEFNQLQSSAVNEFGQSHTPTMHHQREFGQSQAPIMHSQKEFGQSNHSPMHSHNDFSQSQASIFHPPPPPPLLFNPSHNENVQDNEKDSIEERSIPPAPPRSTGYIQTLSNFQDRHADEAQFSSGPIEKGGDNMNFGGDRGVYRGAESPRRPSVEPRDMYLNTAEWDHPSNPNRNTGSDYREYESRKEELLEENIACPPPPPPIFSTQEFSNAGKPPSIGVPAPNEVRARHILIKHENSRNPISWRDSETYSVWMRSREEAVAILQQVLSKWQGKVTEKEFAKTAFEISDCSSSKKEGDLGYFGRGKMQPAFEQAAFSLSIGQIGGIVDTNSGCHLIMRTG